MGCSEELRTAICQLEVSLCCTPCAFIQLHSGRAFNGGRCSSREEIISRQQWDSWYTQTRYTSVSGLGPVLSVKASVIVKGPAGLEGLVVRAMNPSPLQQRLKLWQEGRVRWAAHMWSWWFFYFFFMYRKNVLSLRHAVHAEIPSSRTYFLKTVFVALLHASRILQNLSGVTYLCPVSCNIFYTFPSDQEATWVCARWGVSCMSHQV